MVVCLLLPKEEGLSRGLKKYILVLLIMLLTAAVASARTSYITTRDVKVRAAKGIHAKVLGTIKIRTTVEVTEVDDVWWKIVYKDQDGYVQGKYLKEAPENIPAPTPSVTLDPSNIHVTQVGIGIGCVLAVIVTVRQTRNYFVRKKERLAYRPPEPKVARITHWYQCKHCSASIKKDTEPNIAGCSQSLRHLWIKLGEIGDLKYICKKCSTIITVNAEPEATECPNANGDTHHWKKIA